MTNRRERNRLKRAPLREALYFWAIALLAIGTRAAAALFVAGSV
jgi:hypothetical protein